MNSKWNRSTGVALALVVALAPAAALAGPSGNVTSNNIRDADGTTGQDSTRGSGVKTPHLQNGAVTAPKLAAGAVGATAIADGAVTAPKLGAGSVGTAALGNGAVTAAKLAGSIPSSKLDRTGLDADSVDGLDGSALRRKARNVIVVSQDGNGDFTSPHAAVASIADASETNPYLVLVGPGTYDLGGVALSVRAYVSVVGAGDRATVFTGAVGDAPGIGTYGPTVVALESHARLADVAVRVTGSPNIGAPAGVSVGIHAEGVTVERVRVTVEPGVMSSGLMMWGDVREFRGAHLTVTASLSGIYLFGDGSQYPSGSVELSACSFETTGSYEYGFYGGNSGGAVLRIRDTRISGGRGFRSFFDFVEASNVTVSGPLEISRYYQHQPQRVRISNSSIVATGQAIQNSGGDLAIANTRIEGTIAGSEVFGDAPVFRCFGNYDGSYQPVTCP